MAKKTADATVEGTDTPKSTKCPITRKAFHESAKPLVLKVGDETKTASVKEFSTGSFGWFCNDKLTIIVDGVPVKVQANINLTVIGSKEA